MILFKYFEDILETNGEPPTKFTENNNVFYSNNNYKQNLIKIDSQLNLFSKKNTGIQFIALTSHDNGVILTYRIENKYSTATTEQIISNIDESIDELYKFK